jgi:hypothetical protein
MAAIPISPALPDNAGSRLEDCKGKHDVNREFQATVDAELLHCIDHGRLYIVCVYGYPAADLSVLLTLQGLPSLLTDNNKLLIATSLDESTLKMRIQACISTSDHRVFTIKLSQCFAVEQQEVSKRKEMLLHQQTDPASLHEELAPSAGPAVVPQMPSAPVPKKKGGKQKDAAPLTAAPTATFNGVVKSVVVEAPEAVLPAVELEEVCTRVFASIQSRLVITVEKREGERKGEDLLGDFLQHIIVCHAIKDGWCPFMDGIIHLRTGPSSFVAGGLTNLSAQARALQLLQPAGVLPVAPPDVYNYATIHVKRVNPESDLVSVRISTMCMKLSQPNATELKTHTRDKEPLHLLPTGCELRVTNPCAKVAPAPGFRSALRLLQDRTAASDYSAMRTEAVARWQGLRVHCNITDITFQAIVEAIQLRRLACMGMRSLDDPAGWLPAPLVEASVALPQWRNMLVMHDPYLEVSTGSCSMLLPHECLFTNCSLQRHASRERHASTVEKMKALLYAARVRDNSGAWQAVLTVEDVPLDTSVITTALDTSVEQETTPYNSSAAPTPSPSPASEPVAAPVLPAATSGASAKPFVFARASTMWSKPILLAAPALPKPIPTTAPADEVEPGESPLQPTVADTWEAAPTQPFAAWLNSGNTANATPLASMELLINALCFVQGAHAQLSAGMYMASLSAWKSHNWNEKKPLPISFRSATVADHLLYKKIQNAMSEAAVVRGESPVPNFDFSLLRKEGSMIPLADAGFGRESKGKTAGADAEDDDPKATGSGPRTTATVSGVKRKAPTGAGGTGATKAKQAKKVAFAEGGAPGSAADEAEAANVLLVQACGKDEAGLKKFDMKILKAFLRSKGKKVGGTKPELILRIVNET